MTGNFAPPPEFSVMLSAVETIPLASCDVA